MKFVNHIDWGIGTLVKSLGENSFREMRSLREYELSLREQYIQLVK